MIFQDLDAEDLLKCEAVCRQWRDILLAGRPWRRLYHRNIGRLRLWRKAQKKLELDQKTLQTEQYRGICKDILQQVDRNWRRGHFAKLTCPVSSYCANYIAMNEDYVAWNGALEAPYMGRILCAFLDTESMEINEIPTYFCIGEQNAFAFSSSSEMFFYRHDHYLGNLEVWSRKKRWAVNVWDGLDEGEQYKLDVKFGSKFLVTYCRCKGSDRERMKIWKMGNLPVLLHDRTFKFRSFYLWKVDERFIVLYKLDVTFCFISTETFEEVRSVSWKEKYYDCKYDRGLLFQSMYGFNGNHEMIRILDVASGTFYSDVRLPIRNENGRDVEIIDQWASSNSRFVVIGWVPYESSGIIKFSHLSFYDLEAVKKPSSGRSCYLYTLQFQFEVRSFVMDESRIVFQGFHGNGKRNVTVLDFADFVGPKTSDSEDSDSKDKPETQMKIIFDPYVDCLPLDDAEMMDT